VVFEFEQCCDGAFVVERDGDWKRDALGYVVGCGVLSQLTGGIAQLIEEGG